MPKQRPIRRVPISRYAEPPNHNARSGQLPDHGRSTRHHMIPRSRGGKTTIANLLEVPEKLHQAWHYIFTNMTPEEAMAFIAVHWAPAGYFDLVLLRHQEREILINRQGILRLLSQAIDRSSMPSFHHGNGFLRTPYRRRRRRKQ